jgi:hypothetical protein
MKEWAMANMVLFEEFGPPAERKAKGKATRKAAQKKKAAPSARAAKPATSTELVCFPPAYIERLKRKAATLAKASKESKALAQRPKNTRRKAPATGAGRADPKSTRKAAGCGCGASEREARPKPVRRRARKAPPKLPRGYVPGHRAKRASCLLCEGPHTTKAHASHYYGKGKGRR